MTYEIDKFDRKILKALSQNARMSITELATHIGLSKTPCHNRLKRLEQEGYILGYIALLDPMKMDMEHIAFVEVKLSDTRAKALSEFNAAIRKIHEIEQCHMIAGGFDYLLKIRTQDIRSYHQLLGEKISSLPHLAHTSTFVAMEAVKDIAILA